VLAGLACRVSAELVYRSRRRRCTLAHHVNQETAEAIERLSVPANNRLLKTGEVRLHTVLAGPQNGPVALCLHGFPENWYSWRHQIPLLARLGYRVVVPDQRGYNLSDKPTGIDAYALDRLTADIVGLLAALGRERAVVIGHDWGGVVAWRLAMQHPQRVEKLVVLNAPHPVAFQRELRERWEQRLRSWYALFFQLPALPEALFSLNPLATARLFFARTAVRQDAFDDRDLRLMAAALAQPRALHAMLNWYRAALRRTASGPPRAISAPTLLIWGEDDRALSRRLTEGLQDWVPQLTRHYISNCGHWVQNEAPVEVNAQLEAFLA
jgi:pimeloyl-ACP methyl ester carboxylesterase